MRKYIFSNFRPVGRWGSGSFLEFGGSCIRSSSCALEGDTL